MPPRKPSFVPTPDAQRSLETCATYVLTTFAIMPCQKFQTMGKSKKATDCEHKDKPHYSDGLWRYVSDLLPEAVFEK